MRIKAVPRVVSDYLIDRAAAVWDWYMAGSFRFKVAAALALGMFLVWMIW